MAVSTGACLICGNELNYETSAKNMICACCGGEFTGNISCPQDHFVCDACHSKDSLAKIKNTLESVGKTTNPFVVMDALMDQPETNIHGPEHHALVPIALLAAYSNATASPFDLEGAIDEALKRGSQVPGGICGFWGSCGAAIGVGIAHSIVLGASPLKAEYYSEVNEATARCLMRISEVGGPRCCKRNSYLCLAEAVVSLKELTDVALDSGEAPSCKYRARNKECITQECPYF